MRTLTRSALVLTAAAILVGATAVPAFADDVTVAVDAGDLAITEPAALIMAGVAPGATATGTLGLTTVTDETASEAGWVASVELAALTSADGDVIPAAGVTYTPAAATTTGTTAVAESVATELAAPTAVQTATSSGNNTASWTAVITVDVPDTALAGDYTGTLVTSVL